jgi:hypothetical protein
MLDGPHWDTDTEKGDPDYGKYAEFSFSGTLDWNKKCETCWYGIDTIEPLRVAWQNGSEIIGDFTWSIDHTDLLVQEHVREFIEKKKFNCRFSDKVEYLHNEFLKKRQPHVKLPYMGPKLYWLRCNEYVSIDAKTNELELAEVCKTCERIKYIKKRDGLVISKKEIKGKTMFRIKQYGRSDIKYVTEKGYEELKSHSFTNLHLRLAGEVI